MTIKRKDMNCEDAAIYDIEQGYKKQIRKYVKALRKIYEVATEGYQMKPITDKKLLQIAFIAANAGEVKCR